MRMCLQSQMRGMKGFHQLAKKGRSACHNQCIRQVERPSVGYRNHVRVENTRASRVVRLNIDFYVRISLVSIALMVLTIAMSIGTMPIREFCLISSIDDRKGT